MSWPANASRRVGINSFGFGGSNAHVILDCPKPFLTKPSHVSSFTSDFEDLFADTACNTRPFTLVFSANDEVSLRAYCKAICNHLINPSVSIKLPDLSFTLSERRSRHFHRAYVVTNDTKLEEGDFVFGKKSTDVPKVGFVFTGQGAQWPQMGKALIENFPVARTLIMRLDDALQKLNPPPSWSLLGRLLPYLGDQFF